MQLKNAKQRDAENQEEGESGDGGVRRRSAGTSWVRDRQTKEEEERRGRMRKCAEGRHVGPCPGGCCESAVQLSRTCA